MEESHEALQNNLFIVTTVYTIIVFSFHGELLNRIVFRICLLISLTLFGIGLWLEINNTLELSNWMALFLMSMSLIYLLYFENLRLLFKYYKGINPCVQVRGEFDSKTFVGDFAKKGIWVRYPSDRRVMRSDLVFGFLIFQGPIISIVGTFLF